jgi:hypothetical protein
VRVRSDLTGQFDEVVGSIAHGRNYYYYLVATVKNLTDALSDIFNFFRGGN